MYLGATVNPRGDRLDTWRRSARGAKDSPWLLLAEQTFACSDLHRSRTHWEGGLSTQGGAF